MAGFLRKKTKQDPATKVAPPPVTFSSPSSTPPLFARFATTAQPSNNGVGQRMVSGPLPLASGRKESFKGGSGRTSTSTLVASRDADNARRNVQEQAQLSQASVNYYVPSASSSQYPQSKPRPLSVDKPLPLPAGNEPISPTIGRRTTAVRTPGPPPVFQTTQINGARSRASLDMRDLESKPLPRAGSVQARFWQEVKAPPPLSPKFMPTERNRSLSGPQIGPDGNRKTQPTLPPTSGEQRLPKADDESQSLTPHVSNGPISRQDFPRDSANDPYSHPMSLAGPQQTHAQGRQVGTPMSERVDLPPEFALFQEFSETISRPASAHNEHRHPPSTLKSTEQVPSSSGPRSGIYPESHRNALKPQPTLPQFASAIPQRATSPPLPPPPSDMGVSASHAVTADLLPSSYKDFQAPHVLTSTNGRNSTYMNGSDVMQYYSHRMPTQSHSRSTSPPLPPGAALPATFHAFQGRSQDAVQARTRPVPSFQQPHPQRPPAAGPRAQMGQPQSFPVQDSLRKTPSAQGSSGPLKGKPRIFAAMEVQESDVEPTSEVQPPSSQQIYSQQPQQHQEQPSYHSQPSHLPNEQIHHKLQHVRHLLPSVELKTPKSHQDPLPNDFPNTFEADLRPSSAHKPTASPPKPSLLEQQPVQHSETALRTPRSGSTRSLPHQDEYQPQLSSSQSAARTRKLSKPRHTDPPSSSHGLHNASISSALEPQAKATQHISHRSLTKPHHPSTPISPHKPLVTSLEPVAQVDEDTIRKAGIPLDDDPFARVEGVVLLKPTTPPPAKEGSIKRHRGKGSLKGVSSESVVDNIVAHDEATQLAETQQEHVVPMPLTPVSPEEYRQSRKERKGGKSHTVPVPVVPIEDLPIIPDMEAREPFTLVQFVSDPDFLASLLSYLSFYDWCVMSAVSREIRVVLVRTAPLREVVLETYLRTVGYSRWQWDDQEPLSLSLQDLSDYMRGVSTPTHEYGRVAAMHVHSLTIHPNHRDPSLAETVRDLTSSTRAYNRVLLRLRAQAEKEASVQSSSPNISSPPSASSSVAKVNGNIPSARGGSASRVSSRAPSPTTSTYSYTHGSTHNSPAMQPTASQTSLTFRSPLFRLCRAPLLRVFVPSPEGDWLSDKSVLQCEAECKRAGVQQLMRLGDVVWDVAVGDEGNVGRLVWDGSYLIDLDYTYSAIGDLPKYLPTLAFPPSYFHRVIRTGANVTNPIVHIDVAPWGEEIAMNLQLLQDRVRTETPQGAFHNVVRWVHRSSFAIKPPRGQSRNANSVRGGSLTARIPIPNSNGLLVDPGWYGTIVVETEGTNESLADLQDRCGPGAFPPRPRGVSGHITQAQIENRKVFRILREKSRPGEIWIKTVNVKERLL